MFSFWKVIRLSKCIFEGSSGPPCPSLELHLYLAKPACFWFDCTKCFVVWSLKELLLSSDTPQESLLLATHLHIFSAHTHLSLTVFSQWFLNLSPSCLVSTRKVLAMQFQKQSPWTYITGLKTTRLLPHVFYHLHKPEMSILDSACLLKPVFLQFSKLLPYIFHIQFACVGRRASDIWGCLFPLCSCTKKNFSESPSSELLGGHVYKICIL